QCVKLRAEGPHRIYTELVDPHQHPDYDRRPVHPPGWETFGHRTRFTSLRGFGESNNQIVGYVEEIEKYTQTLELGDVIWPSYSVLFGENLGDVLDEIARRDLFLFDIWGYVPGSGPGGYWQQFDPPEGVFDLLESKLGDRWLGMDVGEQDGRYVGGYAPQMIPRSAGRFEQYLNLQRHFQRMCDDLGNKMSTLLSLNFGHHFLKEGVYTLIGAETAQGLPNAQVYYSFIRGAGKQYGVLWFGNASVFNRWGWKVYGPEGGDGHYKSGPTKGTSLSLLKRLLYSHILYNSVFVGFENNWIDSEGGVSPIGGIQQAAQRWVKEHGQPGVMITPVAVMLDFYSGWSFPRHLYTDNVYRVWGNLPYEAGDYLTDGVLDMLYPGYQDASYFHDESGFLAPTPYGDVADCLLTDAPGWLLDRYPILVVAGDLLGTVETRDKLQRYVENGGRLFITAENLAKFPDGIAGVAVTGLKEPFAKGTAVKIGEQGCVEDAPFELMKLAYPSQARIVARCGEIPAAVEVSSGQGSVTVTASPFGISSESLVEGPIRSEIDKPLPKPYPLLNHVRILLDESLRSQMLFDIGEDLNLITCRRGQGDYWLGISNNSYQQRPFVIKSRCGEIESVEELPLDQSEKGAVGFLPECLADSDVGASDDRYIAGGDVRIFRVRVREENVDVIPHVAPPSRPKGRILPLRGIHSIKESILSRPTFFEHFDGVVVDWRYLRNRERKTLLHEAGWIGRQGLRVFIDLSSGINLYPDLRLLDNIESDYTESMAVINDVIEKMEIIGAHDLIFCLHRRPENNFTQEQTDAAFEKSLRRLSQKAEEREVTLHLRMSPDKPPWNLAEAKKLLKKVDLPNLRIAPCTALLLNDPAAAKDSVAAIRDRIGLWLVSTPALDIGGKLYSVNEPIAEHKSLKKLGEILSVAPDAPIVLDVVYRSQDEEYTDAVALDTVAAQSRETLR
ncbi:MAG: hypothetical protein ABIH23_35345, partial [bacterium]